MKKLRVQYQKTYHLFGETEVEVPDDFEPWYDGESQGTPKAEAINKARQEVMDKAAELEPAKENLDQFQWGWTDFYIEVPKGSGALLVEDDGTELAEWFDI